MPRKYLIVLFFMVFVGARHAVPLQGLAFADSYTQNGQPCPPECVSDSMEIITYYPSPYGYYEELRGDKIIVGDSDNSYINETDLPPTGTITFEPVSYASVSAGTNLYEGTMYYDKNDHKFRYYDNTGSDSTKYWKDLGGGGDYWKPSTVNTDDIYYNTGNVGIGTSNPQTKLEVSGRIKVSEGIVIGNTNNLVAGTIRWTGSDFEGYDGVRWISLSGGKAAKAFCSYVNGSWDTSLNMCFFTGSSCPSGWSYQGYSSYSSVTCNPGGTWCDWHWPHCTSCSVAAATRTNTPGICYYCDHQGGIGNCSYQCAASVSEVGCLPQ